MKIKLSIIVQLFFFKVFNNVLLVDTYNQNQYSYNHFINIIKELGNDVKFIQFYNLKNENIEKYDTVFLLISSDFLNTLDNKIVSDAIKKVNEFKMLPNKLLGLVFPNDDAINIKIKTFLNEVKILGRANNQSLDKKINNFLNLNIYKTRDFDTSLYIKRASDNKKLLSNKKKLNLKNGVYLPFSENKNLNNYFKYGLIYKNEKLNNFVFISKMPILFFNEIEEDFRINPLDINLRKQFEEALNQTVFELIEIRKNIDIDYAFKTQKPLIIEKEKNIKKDKIIHENFNWAKNGITCAWSDLHTLNEIKINNFLDANLNMLWIRFNPEQYLSKNAIKSKDKTKYLDQIFFFTKTLKDLCQKKCKPLPKVFIGLEMTGNFQEVKPADSFVDIFNKGYSKIPTPFDYENFWKIELFDLLDTFFEEWKKFGNDLTISGVFFDFEMYHAQDQINSFIPIGDFSDSSSKCYQKNDLSKFNNTKERIEYLYDHNLLGDYFAFQQNTAIKLGYDIRAFIHQKLPNALIAVYSPTIPCSWFYLGILKGLCSTKDPIILATFNNEFYKHKSWLLENKINCLHISVLLLSKFRTIDDFNLINIIDENHDGVWFNRFSRLSDNYDEKKWFAIESTKLDTSLVLQEISKRNNIQK